jgi:hypothetical protein
VLVNLAQLPRFKTVDQVTNVLNAPRSEAEDLLSWICDTYGSIFTLATDKILIPGFPDDVTQFVVAKQPNAKRYHDFHREIAKKSGKSILLFHGTGCAYLFPILRNGFKVAENKRFGKGTFMAEEPCTAYNFALRRGGFRSHGEKGKNLFRARAIVLGCEVAGKGHLIDPAEDSGPVHLIKNLSSIAVRYIFVLPEQRYKGRGNVYRAPKRAAVKESMVKNFAQF